MSAARPFLISGTAGMVVGLLLLFAGILADGGPAWFAAHGAAMLAGWVLPATLALHARTLERFATAPAQKNLQRLAGLGLAGAGAFTLGGLLQPSGVFLLVAWAGLVVLLTQSIMTTRLWMQHIPRDAVDAERPLTKGDDASWKHIKFSHFFLPVGLLLLVAAYAPFVGSTGAAPGLRGAGMHLLAAFLLLSLYGIGHIWVPRFSGVPAIAAGAIKGELHTSLLGFTGLTIAFLAGWNWMYFVFGPFVFLGFFTYMGVLGANIMRNKSQTHRVTPEFVYIPWTFAGVFWLVSGVLLGLFLNVVPDLLGNQAAALRWIHIHINLLGGAIQLLFGWSTRAFPELRGYAPPRFSADLRLSFYLFNAALVAGIIARVRGPPNSDAMLATALVAVLALLLFGVGMRGFLSSRTHAARP